MHFKVLDREPLLKILKTLEIRILKIFVRKIRQIEVTSQLLDSLECKQTFTNIFALRV